MIYIGFSTQSHKLFAKIFCHHFKHCAPVLIKNKKFILYQFTNRNNINKIYLSLRDIKILQKYNWKFIKYNEKINLKKAMNSESFTCVQFTKKFCNIKNITIQTPDKLFKYLSQK